MQHWEKFCRQFQLDLRLWLLLMLCLSLFRLVIIFTIPITFIRSSSFSGKVTSFTPGSTE